MDKSRRCGLEVSRKRFPVLLCRRSAELIWIRTANAAPQGSGKGIGGKENLRELIQPLKPKTDPNENVPENAHTRFFVQGNGQVFA